MAEKSKILVIGGTGYIGKIIVETSVKAGHPTFALVRETTKSNPDKAKLIDSFKTAGVTLVQGDIFDHKSLVKAIERVDVVISAVSLLQIADQVNIIAAIKEAGNVKRFIPSEYGTDVDRANAVEPVATSFRQQVNIRRLIEAEGIPYTYVVSHSFLHHVLHNLAQLNSTTPPRDKVTIAGDGNTKAIFVGEEDVATYTIKAAEDPRTLNKILFSGSPANTLSFNEIVSLWEKKIGNTLDKIYIPEDQLLKQIQESSLPNSLLLSIDHFVYVKGENTNASFGVEVSELYPEVKYTTVDQYLDGLV